MKWRFVTDLLDWSCFASELQRNWSFCIWQPAARLSGATVNPGVVQRNASLLVRIGRLKGWVHSSVTNSVIIYSTSCQRRAREKFPQNISGASCAQVKQTPLDPNLVWKYHFYAQIFTFAAEFKARTGACWCSLKWCTKLICNVYKNKKIQISDLMAFCLVAFSLFLLFTLTHLPQCCDTVLLWSSRKEETIPSQRCT